MIKTIEEYPGSFISTTILRIMNIEMFKCSHTHITHNYTINRLYCLKSSNIKCMTGELVIISGVI